MSDTARVTINNETIMAELIRQAREDYSEKELIGLDKLSPVSRQKHKRYHTPYVTKDIVAKAVPGSWCNCAYNIALRAMPGVFGAITMLRVVHTLEKDENGKWVIYDYSTPTLAAERILKFDQLKGMPEHMISIKPFPKSWYRENNNKIKKKSAANKNRKIIKRAQKPKALQRAVSLRDFLNGDAG